MDRDQILASLRERIVAFAASRIARDVAEDLAQEVLVLLHEKYSHVTRLEELLPLSFQIVRFKLTSLRRKTARRGEYTQVSVEDIQLPDPGTDPSARLERQQMSDQLAVAIAKLEGRCRDLFRLKLEGKTERKYYDEQMITGAPIKALAFLVGIFTAIGASFGAMNTMYAQVSSRTREIGTLRAIGFSRRSILVSFVIEALMLCLAGGLLGIAFTFLVFNLFLTKPTGTMNFRTFSEVLFNFRMTPPLIAGGLAFALAMGVVGGFFPAFRAARLKITTALREV